MKSTSVIRFVMALVCAFVFAFSTVGISTAQASGAPEQSDFLSPETVAVGCGAGIFAGGFASALPAIYALPGQSTLVTLPIVTAWALIGCGVGVVAGLSAVLTQAALSGGL